MSQICYRFGVKASINNGSSISRRVGAVSAIAFVLALNFTLVGCVYRRLAPAPPSQQRLKIVADSPELYVVRSRILRPRDYQVPADGHVTLDVPSYWSGCSVYLFDRIRIRSGVKQFTKRDIDVVLAGKTVRQFSLKQIHSLPVDGDGFHVLAVRAGQ